MEVKLGEPVELQGLAQKVITLYRDLFANPMILQPYPFRVYIVSDLADGTCSSRHDRVFVLADQLDSRTFLEEMFGAATKNQEYWVQIGLASLYLKEQPDPEELREWYAATPDLDIAGLFIAYFREDWATGEEIRIARLSAASLVQYALTMEHIAPQNLSAKVDNEVRTRWLRSLGVQKTVDYAYDGRFVGFDYSQNSSCSLIVQTDMMQFCLNRLLEQEFFDQISEAEFLLDYTYYGRNTLENYLLIEAPSVHHQKNPNGMIFLEVRDLENRLGYTDGSTITINQSAVYYDPLHEIVHTFAWNELLFGKNVWLSEGFAEYLGKLLPIYPQTMKRCIFEDLSGRVWSKEDADAPEVSYCYFLWPEQLQAAREWYQAQGGTFEDEASINPRLFTDAVAFATLYKDAYPASRGLPIGLKYEFLGKGRAVEGQEGLELSYTQAASFVAWLCDTYSIDRVLDVYVNHAEDGMLDGKNYMQLKSLWHAHLLSKGEGIDLPGAP